MTTALYRRYRPETFGEMIGQSQVTDPLMTALRGDRVGHAYLFSGPRGCGKTTSARILARCLNCAEGPTDVPCGTCPSCVELSRAGGGSLDVVEIDAASHNGVDDARDLRERATFAPSRDRYKIFILDEAHMVTPQGFNALLKLVEEPPEHVKFIFATTEPEKVLGTIRSRTHHYPFRLVPPAAMLEYVEKLCTEEGVVVEQGVLPLVVRAGGGSPRDTLSLLDQLIAGSDAPAGSATVTVGYARAVALLGYTHGALLDEIVDALAAGDAAAAFPAIDRVVQTGQDPRRFVDDLLERLRDLIVIAAVGNGASAVLRGIAEDDLERMRGQADVFGAARLSRTADVVSAALDDMSGATSPRLHLELMVARVLASAKADAEARGGPAVAAAAPAAAAPVRTASPAPAGVAPSVQAAVPPAPEVASATPVAPLPASVVEAPAAHAPAADAPAADAAPAAAPAPSAAPEPGAPSSAPTGPVTFSHLTAAWPAVLTRLEGISRTSWLVVTAVQPLAYDTDSEVLTLGFASQHDVGRFKGTTPGSGTSDHLRTAIEQELGVRVKYLPAPLPAGGAARAPQAPSNGSAPAAPAKDLAAPKDSSPNDAAPKTSSQRDATPAAGARPQSRSSSAPAVTEWAVAPIPAGEAPRDAPAAPLPVDDEPEEVEAAASAPTPPRDGSVDRSEPPLPGDDDAPDFDDEPPYDPSYEPAPSGGPPPRSQSPSAPQAAPRAAAAPAPRAAAPVVTERSPSAGGVQRYGEAVIRQVLGATFVREEPYEPPTRFA
ncbi:DNA polymerase III subunit gamma/tau [Microbacterium oxydans]|uniref:DNA polymerase III subunit gamma/tau n=1 Tax=Microbacterium oxydans TaxID=82380 RepID=A0A0F0LAN4_9MICO|nr:DNA polymerase III subunit gamma and tau [Microbacterium oxydans]KJL28646.1 DNA polymerase III subunit tau [Microbacterium oxydans]CAH0221557.1 DNA polymerase III subunit gamma/tau [Microbacterium oxydans]